MAIAWIIIRPPPPPINALNEVKTEVRVLRSARFLFVLEKKIITSYFVRSEKKKSMKIKFQRT